MVEIKRLEELTNIEIIDIFKARIMVFVVEQNCPYQEVDDYDKECYHAYIKENNEILAYLRIILKEDYAIIGRVITTKRNMGYGKEILNEAISFIKDNKYNHIEIEAQTYAVGFYEKCGFKSYGKTFMMDGIEHIKMKLIMK